MTISSYIIIAFFGAAGGFLSGFLGVGGGILFIPVLDYYLRQLGLQSDELVKAILANSLFTIIFSSSMSCYQQFKAGNFHPKEILFTSSAGVVTAIITTWLIKQGTWYSIQLFTIFFAVMLLFIAARMLFIPSNKSIKAESTQPVKYASTGFFAGIITAMSGLGGGVVMTPVFTDWIGTDMKKASAISNGVIPIFAVAIGALNLNTTVITKVSDWQMGTVVFPVVLPLIIGSMLLAPFGVATSHKVNSNTTRKVFAVLVSIIFFKTIFQLFFT
ncbi:MAG: sulfite exporter TauE/SafE family protein [Bacteroidia bacterium]|jgi:uncharacterized membrane protein YfcA|nr:sulfite exporter TauE/SafE family protein [Bacteroidia bacterium]